MPIYHYTDRQKEIQQLLHEQGFGTKMEVPCDRFCIDILVPELENLVVEIVGPSHYQKELFKREEILRQYGYRYFLYIPVDYTDTEFLDILNKRLGEWFGSGLRQYHQ